MDGRLRPVWEEPSPCSTCPQSPHRETSPNWPKASWLTQRFIEQTESLVHWLSGEEIVRGAAE